MLHNVQVLGGHAWGRRCAIFLRLTLLGTLAAGGFLSGCQIAAFGGAAIAQFRPLPVPKGIRRAPGPRRLFRARKRSNAGSEASLGALNVPKVRKVISL
jgi:hypothetical protein